MTEPRHFLFEQETTRNKGKECEVLWYLMRIVGNKSDILIQNVLDALLSKRKGIDSSSEAANTDTAPTPGQQQRKTTTIIESIIPHIDLTAIQQYVYPKVILQNARKKQKEASCSPLLTGYIFCKASEELLVALVNRLPNFIFCYPRPINATKRIVINNAEMDNFIKALEATAQSHNLQIIPYEEAHTKLHKGTKVRIEGGPLNGLLGIVSQHESKNHLFITLGGRFTLDIKLKRTDKVVNHQ